MKTPANPNVTAPPNAAGALAPVSGSASPRRITLKQNHNGRWALRMGDLELQALASMVHLEMGCGWTDGEKDPALVDAAVRLHRCLMDR